MVEILQGETLTMALAPKTIGESSLDGFAVRAALRPAFGSFRRDCTCGDAVLLWEDIEVVDGVAVWVLTSEQSNKLSVGKYAMEVALMDITTGEFIKDATSDIIEVKQSYTR